MALRNGSRFSVGMADVFPDGCYLVPGSISEAQDYDEKTKTRSPAKDKVTGTRPAGFRPSEPGHRQDQRHDRVPEHQGARWRLHRP